MRRGDHKLLHLLKLVHAAGRKEWGGGAQGSGVRSGIKQSRGCAGRCTPRSSTVQAVRGAPACADLTARPPSSPPKSSKPYRKMPSVSRPWEPASLRKQVE